MSDARAKVLVFLVCGAGVGVGIVAGLLQQRSRRRSKITLPPVSLTQPGGAIRSDRASLSILPSGMLDKYETELRLAHAFLALALVVVGLLPLAAIGWGDASLRLLGLLTLPLDAILIGLALRARSETLAEKDLALRGAGEGLTLSPSGVRVNIALTEGAYRDWLRKGRHPIGELRWDEIEALRIEPATSQPKSSTPAYFKLTLRKPFAKARWWEQTHGAIFILRRPFRGRENEIVEYVKAHAGLPIELYDTLR